MNENKTKHMKGSLGIVFLVGILVVLVAVGSYVYFNSNKNPPVKSPTPTESPKIPTAQAQVTITSKGFEPATIAIKKGEQVTWTNTDSKPHQVASDPHPTHTGLAGFDSKVALTTNDAYAYTFEKSGTFTYHDHLNPLKYHGTVIVEK